MSKIDLLSKSDHSVEDEYDFEKSAEQVAEERGLRVVYPNPNQLQIDLDSAEATTTFYARLDEMNIPLEWVVIAPSAGGLPNQHATITFPKRAFWNEYERIALQFMLGSDPVRERLNLKRLEHGIQHPTRLFEL